MRIIPIFLFRRIAEAADLGDKFANIFVAIAVIIIFLISVMGFIIFVL
ncbi:MAG: hypothetical protein Q8O30_07840 [Candidatus Omnitrophota bacterium]|nr:hypothetical protein [Candidatus Omnitrophota bacterium]